MDLCADRHLPEDQGGSLTPEGLGMHTSGAEAIEIEAQRHTGAIPAVAGIGLRAPHIAEITRHPSRPRLVRGASRELHGRRPGAGPLACDPSRLSR